MGKYSNVNANSLTSTINTALNELSKYNINYIHNNLNKSDVIESRASIQIDAAFNKIINNKNYNGNTLKLKEILNNLKNAAENIIKCQNLEKEIIRLEEKLYKSDGTKNYSIQSQINSKKRSLTTYENKVDSLLSK